MGKQEKEITIRITVSLDEIKEILKKGGFSEGGEFEIYDIYMIPEEFKDIEKYDEKRLLNLSVRIRETIENNISQKGIVKKDKEFDEDDQIIKEEKYVCRIKDVDEANKLLNQLGYVELFSLNQKAKSYIKGNAEIVLSEINGRIYIEIEDRNLEGKVIFNSSNEMIQFIKENNIPHVEGEYFVQKAIDELKFLKDKNK